MANEKSTPKPKVKLPKASPTPPKPTNEKCWIGSPRKRFPGSSVDVDLRHCPPEQLTLLKKEHPSFFNK